MKEYSDLEDCDLYRHIYDATSQIPRGMVSTYGDIAEALGDKAASRAVGTTLSSNPRPIVVPCHRVVYRDGRVGWYRGLGKGNDTKTRLLREEGLEIVDGVVQNLEALRFDRFDLRPVLREMRELQSLSAAEVATKDDFDPVERIVGLDVSYEGDDAFAAAVTLDVKSGDISTRISRTKVEFPYVPGYLSFREMPSLIKLLDKENGTVVLVDGQGRLHPRRFGIASHLGVRTGLPTVGVAKSILTGQVQENGDILLDGELMGRAIVAGRRRYYVSVGHRISLGTAESIVLSYLSNTRTDVLRMAHVAATEARKGVPK
ncbi:MAG: endonuclease V [Euryarchaeota archaeon]|nr:endonuclease V [Euryarchaeota archaeon]